MLSTVFAVPKQGKFAGTALALSRLTHCAWFRCGTPLLRTARDAKPERCRLKSSGTRSQGESCVNQSSGRNVFGFVVGGPLGRCIIVVGCNLVVGLCRDRRRSQLHRRDKEL